MAEPLTLTVSEVADLLHIKPSSVYSLIARGDIPSVRFGRLVRVPKNELENLVRSGLSGGESTQRGVASISRRGRRRAG